MTLGSRPINVLSCNDTPSIDADCESCYSNFLGKFVEACQGCHFDIINFHHYVPRSQLTVDQAVSALKSYIEKSIPALQAQYPQLQGLPLMIGEAGTIYPSDWATN